MIMNYVILESIIKSLVPIAIVVVLPIIMAWLSYRNKQHETDKRSEIVTAIIEKNPDVDVQEFLSKLNLPKKSYKEQLMTKMHWEVLWGTLCMIGGTVMIVTIILIIMESILWSQGASPTESSTFVINGTIKREKYSESNQKAYDKLISMSELPILHPNITNLLYKRGLISSYQTKIAYKKGDGIFFKSIYKSLDEAGRNIPYMFYCQTDNIDEAYAIFCRDSQMAGREIYESEGKMLKLIFNLNKYTLISISLIIIAIIWKIIS